MLLHRILFLLLRCAGVFVVLLTWLARVTAQNSVANSPPRFLLDGGSSDVGGDIVLRLKEGSDTPAGTKILQLRGYDRDGDPLTFGVRGVTAERLLEVKNHHNSEASVYLKQELDAETEAEYQVVLTLTDGHLGAGNFITQSLLILVEDVNDNAPVFLPFPNTISVEEHSGSRVIAVLEATDRDSGIFGQVVYDLQAGEAEDKFSIATASDGRGMLSVVGDLDYETQSVYQLEVLARDRANFGRVNTATAALLVTVIDIADQPPEFVSVPSVTRIPEDLPRYAEVLRVRAVDGDRQISKPIVYSIVSGPAELFAINADTGIVYTLSEVDREAASASNGAYILEIEAAEVGDIDEPSVRTEVTIIIEDINDESPQFRNSKYVAEIWENAQPGTPISFVGSGVIPEVFDHDQGTNGTFRLFLEDDNGVFEVTPDQGINDASFAIRVRESKLLDYEKTKVVNFTLVARETVPISPHESRVKVTVHIRDQNDNSPTFTQDKYEVEIPEDLRPGGTVAWIRATDLDSGLLGTSGIRYTRLSGPVADYLNLDKETGLITLSHSTIPLASNSDDSNDSYFISPFDREKSGLHYLTVEARDDVGRGNRNTVELIIRLTDVNDNAPKFLTNDDGYETFLPENSAQFPSPFQLHAEDADENGTENSEVRYKIVRGDVGGNFSIDSVSGEITPNGIIDYESMSPTRFRDSVDEATAEETRSFQLTVRAFDLGNPPLYSDTSVAIFVRDVNDHAPQFLQSHYRVSVDEDIKPGSEILRVFANDADGSAPNNEVVYRLEASGAKDKFVIDPLTGVIRVSDGASLDPDLTSPKTFSYFMEVVALDGGLGKHQKSSVATINVTIVDVNNKPPYFEQQQENPLGVLENAHVGTFITRLVAKDPDRSAKLRYSLDIGKSEVKDENERHISLEPGYDLESLFELDSNQGDLRVVGSIDRELTAAFKLVIRVEDMNARAGTRQVAYTTVHLEIRDENDNNPEFSKSVYMASVVENAVVGSSILSIQAFDRDLNRSIGYTGEGSQKALDHLHIDTVTGDVRVGARIDRELISWLNFTLRATDSGVPPRSSFADVFIKVLDENDNSPVFHASTTTTNLTVSEDISPGTVVSRIWATDADSGEFGRVTYFLDVRSSEGKFSIDPDSGELVVSAALDREERDEYSLIVQAYDNYQFGFTTGDSRNAFAHLTVHVLDVNDQAPVFERSNPEQKEHSCAVITEFHDTSEPVLTLRATDGDDPDTDNGKLTFSIKAGNDLGLFRIAEAGATAAWIFPNRQLQGYYGNYSLTVEARDRGNPSNAVTEKFSICVQDFNDNAPRFISPPGNYTIRVPENASLGAEVITVRAVDTDIGANGQVRYRLRKDPLGNYRTFEIDPVSGMITLKRGLDRERQKLYEIRVEAYDLGVPTSLQSDLDLTIYVKNVNDHPPLFLIDEFTANFTEHRQPGLERVLLVETVDRDEEDENDELLEVCYYIVGGNQAGLFELDPLLHELTTTTELDRESQSEYLLTIKASDECLSFPEWFNSAENKQKSDASPAEMEFDPRDDTLLRVRVVVTDIDDNPPVFEKDIFTGGISTDVDFGAGFMAVSAVDEDIGENARLTYTVEGDVFVSKDSEGLESAPKDPFRVDPDTGVVHLNFDPQKGMKGYFTFEVGVTDRAGHSDQARVQIYLLREDQRVKFVVRSQPGEMRERMGKFRDLLSGVTDAIVNVDAFQVHENKDGSVDKTKTDVLLHLVDPKDNTVMEVDDVLKLIDYRTEELDAVFKEFDVLYTEGVEPIKVQVASTETVIIFWLIGIIGFLVVLLIIVICLCIHQRKRYLRKIRAATVSSFGANGDTTMLAKRDAVPNTNRHAIEGSNPIWMTGMAYDNFQYNPDDDDDDLVHHHHRTGKYAASPAADPMDSLDANVLNESIDVHPPGMQRRLPPHQEGSSECSELRACGDDDGDLDTLRVGSANKLLDSPRSSSSGVGSGPSRRFGTSGIGPSKKNMTISALFPSQMPPVEKLNARAESVASGKSRGNKVSPGHGSSRTLGRYGDTVYDEDHIPRTEL